MKNEITVKPCPFCGCKRIRMYGSIDKFWLECRKCITGPGELCETEEKAVKRWNKRPPIPKLVATPDMVEKIIDKWSYEGVSNFMGYNSAKQYAEYALKALGYTLEKL